MYFPFWGLKKWGKRTAETRRHNCTVLPQFAPIMNKSRNFSESPCFFPQVRYNISTQVDRVLNKPRMCIDYGKAAIQSGVPTSS